MAVCSPGTWSNWKNTKADLISWAIYWGRAKGILSNWSIYTFWCLKISFLPLDGKILWLVIEFISLFIFYLKYIFPFFSVFLPLSSQCGFGDDSSSVFRKKSFVEKKRSLKFWYEGINNVRVTACLWSICFLTDYWEESQKWCRWCYCTSQGKKHLARLILIVL